jgi:hypothetical protein
MLEKKAATPIVTTRGTRRVRDDIPTLDNLRNFLLTPITEMLSFFQNLRAQ